MQEPNRQIPPKTVPVDSFDTPKAEISKLSNDIPLYIIHAGTEDIVKIDIQFRAGDWFHNKPLVAESTSEMLTEGTKNMTSAEIAYKMDFYGAILRSVSNKDTATITALTLKKHLEPILQILSDIIKHPEFPEKEFITYLENKKQQFHLEHSRVNTLSREKFHEAIFGRKHPYGRITEYEDHERLSRNDLIQFHASYYTPENCHILITGNTDANTCSVIDKYLGNGDWKTGKQIKIPPYSIQPADQQEIFTKKPDAVQAAIRMGYSLFNKHHPDYLGMKIVTTILGGYFGSRLMKKVREEKGYTYGISAILASFVHEGYFAIVSEVGSNVCRKATGAIKNEIIRLKEEKVGTSEMDMVRNYMTGELMRMFDGPLSTSSSYLTILESQVSEDYFNRLFNKINNITSDEIIELANKYLDEEKMILSIAGQCND
ncbi:MAG: pitrilysin family protein [Bacteroidales bacterium]